MFLKDFWKSADRDTKLKYVSDFDENEVWEGVIDVFANSGWFYNSCFGFDKCWNSGFEIALELMNSKRVSTVEHNNLLIEEVSPELFFDVLVILRLILMMFLFEDEKAK